MSLIKYDKEVMEAALRAAERPGATQKDMVKYLRDEHVLGWQWPDGSFAVVSYLAPEARTYIWNLMKQLPRRRHTRDLFNF